MEKCNKRIITLSGDPGSGKGSVSEKLKERYNTKGVKVKIVSVGKLYRKTLLREYKKKFPQVEDPSLEEIYGNPDFAEKIKEIDQNMDNEIANLVREFYSQESNLEEVLVLDSRRAVFILAEKIPEVAELCFDVRLETDANTAGKRIYEDPKRGPEDKYETPEEAIQDTASRRAKEIETCKEQYNGKDLTNHKHYDLVIDTTLASVEDIADTIQICEELKRQGKPFCKTWASPELFYPTQDDRDTESDTVWSIENEEDKKKYLGYPYASTWQLSKLYPDKKIGINTTSVDIWKRGRYTVYEMAELIQQLGIYPDDPITASSIENSEYKFVNDGHHRVFGSIIAGKTLVPYEVTRHIETEEISERQHKYIIGHQFRRLDGSQFRYAKIPAVMEKKEINAPNQDDEQEQK